jgi:hypothetical protein
VQQQNCNWISVTVFGLLCLILSTTSLAQNYTAEKATDHGVAVVRLRDAANDTVVSVVPSPGNLAYEMRVHGKNILYFPYDDLSEFVKAPKLGGTPFLAPWADLLDFEPLAAIIDGVNLARQGKYADLQTWPSGATWTESFWVRASGIKP